MKLKNIEVRVRVKCPFHSCDEKFETWVDAEESTSQPGAMTLGNPRIPEGWGYREMYDYNSHMGYAPACPEHREKDENYRPVKR